MGTAIILFIIGICLILLNLRAINKESSSFGSVLKQKQVDMTEVNVEIGKLRREFAETLLDIQTQMVDLENGIKEKEKIKKNSIGDYKDNNSFNDKITDIVDINFDKVKKQEKKEKYKSSCNITNKDNGNNSNLKVKEIEKYIDKGLSVEEIADILKVGKGEILLIKELYLK